MVKLSDKIQREKHKSHGYKENSVDRHKEQLTRTQRLLLLLEPPPSWIPGRPRIVAPHRLQVTVLSNMHNPIPNGNQKIAARMPTRQTPPHISNGLTKDGGKEGMKHSPSNPNLVSSSCEPRCKHTISGWSGGKNEVIWFPSVWLT